MIKQVIAITALSLGAQAFGAETATDSITCVISGKVIGRPQSKEALLLEAGKDFRIAKAIPVTVADGTFSYTLRDDMPRAYSLYFEDEIKTGSWTTRNFFTGDGKVTLICDNDDFTIKSELPDNIEANRIEKVLDGKVGARLDSLYAGMNALADQKKDLKPALQEIYDKAMVLQPCEERDSLMGIVREWFGRGDEEVYSTEYLALYNETTGLFAKRDSLLRVMISERPTLAGLFEIKEKLSYGRHVDWVDIDDYIRIFDTVYKDKMSHPYVAETAMLIESQIIKAGNRYPDYRIRKTDGSAVRISELIHGNVAVIDLWASWCGPCRQHSKELIPLYEKYKDKGFKVVAIAREQENCDKMVAAMKKDGYPWESFVDVDDKDNVWKINNAGLSGGKIILVDRDGTIIGTDISTKEIADFLSKAYPD